MPDLIFVSLENWDEIWRRNQFVCAEWARRHPQATVLFVGLPINVSNAVRRGQLRRIFAARSYPPAVEGANVVVTHPLKLLPDSIGLGRWINAAMFRRHVKKEVRRLGLERPMLWLNPQSAVHMVGRMNEAGCIYDVTDDWTALSQSESLRKRIIADDAELCGKADAVIVCSQRLLEMKRAMARRVHLIPNGVEVEHYAGVTKEGPVPETARGWAKPVFGYTGTAHPDRVDVKLVAELSERLAQHGKGSLVFVGPNHLPGDVVGQLTARGNVYFTGAVPYLKIPEYMRAFDVCVVPHRMSAFTESLNPIKLFEYLAAGKPIVATDVAGFRDFPELVRIARTADEFFDQMLLALQEGDSKLQARRDEAAKHSWKLRVDQIEEVLMSIGRQPIEPSMKKSELSGAAV
jgi:glycosyltransferase involved in cell wall biosynthesis